MITITENAVDKIKLMAEGQDFSDQGVRVMVVGGGCAGFTYDMDFEDQARDDDEVVEQHGLKVYVDAMSACYLDGTTVDFVESLDFSGFHFDNPSATRTCGCGSSFS
ncbi:MAG TPA: iron-sulfur cluster assembly accessory protein [Myxococcales bacterium]|nr:iron-sulfur cluster assembly accessory protein [Myxococcales bacterium]